MITRGSLFLEPIHQDGRLWHGKTRNGIFQWGLQGYTQGEHLLVWPFINIENSDKSNPDNKKWYSLASCYSLPCHQNPCSGDRKSDGAEDEQASFKQNEHAKGNPAYEQAETSQHSEVSFSSWKQSDLLIFCPDMRLCAFTRVNFMPSLNILRWGALKKKTSKEGAIYIVIRIWFDIIPFKPAETVISRFERN